MAFGPLAAPFLAAAVLHFLIAAFVAFTQPRRVATWLVTSFLALLGGSALARGLLVASGGIDPSGQFASGVPWWLVSVDLEWPASFLVLGIALVYPREVFPSTRGRVLLGAAGVLALALTVWVIVDKGRFYEVQAGSLGATWISVWLDDARYFFATTLALALFGAAFLRRPSGSPDRSAEYLLIAFAIAPLSSLVRALTITGGIMTQSGTPMAFTRAAITIGGTILIAVTFFTIVALARRRGHRIRALAGWGIAAVAFGSLALSETLTRAPFIATAYGELLYLVVRPCLIGYAILRHQLFDIDIRVKHGFATALLALAVAAIFIPVEETVRRLSGLPADLALSTGIAGGLAVSLVLFSRVQAFARGASDRLFAVVREDDAKYLLSRKRDIYRALVERAPDANAPDVLRLRRSLEISDELHAEILAEARGEPPPGGPVRPGALLAGRYRVLDTLGPGASGVTYRCEDTTLHREVAVKEIDLGAAGGRARARAIAEARRLAAIRHDHVVTLLDVQEARGRTLLIMELLQGGSLAARLARGALAPEEARRVLIDTLEGLEALHRAGFVHRDVKPSNILLDARGRAKVADLGIASASEAETVTRLSPAGTPLYMAPEQLLGLPVDARTDVYAASALLYEMLSGEAYARVAMRRGLLIQEAIVSAPPPLPLAAAPAWANAFLQRGLAKDPTARFPTAADAILVLTRGPGTGGASDPTSGRPPDASARSPLEEAGAS